MVRRAGTVGLRMISYRTLFSCSSPPEWNTYIDFFLVLLSSSLLLLLLFLFLLLPSSAVRICAYTYIIAKEVEPACVIQHIYRHCAIRETLFILGHPDEMAILPSPTAFSAPRQIHSLPTTLWRRRRRRSLVFIYFYYAFSFPSLLSSISMLVHLLGACVEGGAQTCPWNFTRAISPMPKMW